MKNLAKLFAFVAALFAFSCTTDATDDLGVQLGGDQTVIPLSLEETRTQLGEKAGETYPLYWDGGDKISVNGVESGEAVISPDDPTKASFAISAITPYNIAYPAAPMGQVLFAEHQEYTSNTSFANGAATMYAFSEDGSNIQLNHLTGVLKIGVVGKAKLAMAQISTVDRAPIAGLFDLDFPTGELRACPGSKEVIEYSFGEGVQLSTDPTYIHVAVPAGVYDELYVTLYDVEGGVMYATVKAGDEKPLSVGKVREFSSNIEFAATDQVFVVKDLATLKEFAAQAATLEKDVLFVNDIDASSEPWTSIEGYTKTVRGNGYAIKGLNAPLFGATNASIKGLHLRDVNIQETVLPIVGAFARNITATDTEAPIIEHCSAQGRISVNCTEYEPLEGSHVTINVSGLVGYGLGVSFYNCKNEVEIEVLQLAKTGNTTNAVACVGGICSFAYTHKRTDASVVTYEFANCENAADINVTEKSYTGQMTVEGSGTFSPLAVWVGGISCSDYSSGGQANTNVAIANLVNRGNITVSTYSGDCFIGGVIGNSYSSNRENWTNYGTITLKESFTSRTFLAGVAGCIQGSTFTKGTNYGEVKAETSKSRNVNAAGVIALDKGTINDCENHGTLYIAHETALRTEPYGAYKEYAVGGVIGTTSSTKAITGCTNYGEVNVSGNIANCNPADTFGYFGVGGLVGVLNSPVRDCHNEGAVNVSATVLCVPAAGEVAGNAEVADFAVGGLVGSNRVNSNNGIVATNKGNVTVIEGSFDGPLYVGGLVGYAQERLNGNGSIGHTTNHGNITVCEIGNTVTCKNALFAAGCVAYQRTNHATDNDNYGTVTINKGVTTNKRTCIGGVFGIVKAITTRSINNGAVKVSGVHNNSIAVGGVVGYHTVNYLSICDNFGDITIADGFESAGDETTSIGGIVGLFYGKNSSDKLFGLQTSNNHGSITVEKGIVVNNDIYIAGISGYTLGSNMISLINNGHITINGTYNKRFGVAGCAGYGVINVDPENFVTNNGNITITPNTVCNTDAYIGGVMCIATQGHPLRNATNTGDISVSGKYEFTSQRLCIAGVLGWDNLAGLNTLINSGDITINSDFRCTQTTGVKEIAGCVGLAQSTVTNAFNTGNITIKSGAKIKDGHYIGGCLADARSAIYHAHNIGNITVEDVAAEGNNSFAGGAVGKIGASKTIEDIVSYCHMKVFGYTNCGFLVGSHRTSTVTLQSGAVGGTHYTYDESDAELKPEIITADNFFHYIYGSGSLTSWPDEETPTYDNVTFLTEKPTVPPVADEGTEEGAE